MFWLFLLQTATILSLLWADAISGNNNLNHRALTKGFLQHEQTLREIRRNIVDSRSWHKLFKDREPEESMMYDTLESKLLGEGAQGCASIVNFHYTHDRLNEYYRRCRAALENGNKELAPHPIVQSHPDFRINDKTHVFTFKSVLNPHLTNDPKLMKVVDARLTPNHRLRYPKVPIEYAIAADVYDPQNPTTINYYEYFYGTLRSDHNRLLTVMVQDYFDGRSLQEHINLKYKYAVPMDERKLQELERESLCILIQITEAMESMHRKNYAHLDLYTENVLVKKLSDRDDIRKFQERTKLFGCVYEVRVIDFGHAVANANAMDRAKFLAGIPTMFASPEVLMTRHNSDFILEMTSKGSRTQRGSKYTLCQDLCQAMKRTTFNSQPSAVRALRISIEDSCLKFEITRSCDVGALRPFLKALYSRNHGSAARSEEEALRNVVASVNTKSILDGRPSDMYALGVCAMRLFMAMPDENQSINPALEYYQNNGFRTSATRLDWIPIKPIVEHSYAMQFGNIPPPDSFIDILTGLITERPEDRDTATDLLNRLELLWARYDKTRSRMKQSAKRKPRA